MSSRWSCLSRLRSSRQDRTSRTRRAPPARAATGPPRRPGRRFPRPRPARAVHAAARAGRRHDAAVLRRHDPHALYAAQRARKTSAARIAVRGASHSGRSPSQQPSLKRQRGHCHVWCRHSIGAAQRRQRSGFGSATGAPYLRPRTQDGRRLTRRPSVLRNPGRRALEQPDQDQDDDDQREHATADVHTSLLGVRCRRRYNEGGGSTVTAPATMRPQGDVAEWLGRGLQSLVQRFESARRLSDHDPAAAPAAVRCEHVARGMGDPCNRHRDRGGAARDPHPGLALVRPPATGAAADPPAERVLNDEGRGLPRPSCRSIESLAR